MDRGSILISDRVMLYIHSQMVFEQKYSRQVREAATARVLERLDANPHDRHAISDVAKEYEIGPQSLRAWVRRARGTAHEDAQETAAEGISARIPEMTLAELRAEIEELRRQQDALRNENHILKQAFKIFT